MRPTVVTLVDAARKLLLACAAAATFVPDVAPAAESTLRVAVTTSFVSSGAAARLTPAFEQQTGIRVKLVVVGSGSALRMARVGEVDATLTHSPEDEQAFVDDGLAAAVREVMSNDMLIVGPAGDPAAARGSDTVAALARIAAAGQPFVSRGDDSGTDQLELSLWKLAGIDPLGKSWYEEIGRGMPEALQYANRRGAYVLVDRGTWLADRASLRLKTVVEGDPRTANHYVAIAAQAAGRAPTPAAQAWVQWLGSARARQLISGLQVDGGRAQLYRARQGQSGELRIVLARRRTHDEPRRGQAPVLARGPSGCDPEGVECRKDSGVIDETPGAYKDIDAVMAAQDDLVEVVHTLKQVVCVKG